MNDITQLSDEELMSLGLPDISTLSDEELMSMSPESYQYDSLAGGSGDYGLVPAAAGLVEGGRRFATGMGQMIMAGEKAMGTATPEEYANFTYEESKRRYHVQQEDWWKNSATAKVTTFIGEMLPWFAFRPLARTPTGRIGEATAMGGFGGAAQFTSEEDERFSNILMGSATGLGVQGVLDFRPRTEYMRRNLNSVYDDPDYMRNIQESMALGEDGASLTFAEVSEHPFFISLQRSGMAGTQAPAWKIHRMQALESTDNALQEQLRFFTLADEVPVSGEKLARITPRQSGAMVRRTYKAHTDNIYSTAETQFGLGMREVDKLVGGKAFVDSNNVVNEINQIIKEWSVSGSKSKLAKIKELEIFRDSLQKSKYSPEGNLIGQESRFLTAKEATNKFKSWGKASRGDGRAVFHDEGSMSLDKEVAPRIYRAFMEGMDSQATTHGTNMNREAMEKFLDIRSVYGDAMDYATTVKNSTLGALMEKAYKKSGSTPDTAFHKALRGLPDDELQSTLTLMNEVNPHAVTFLQKRMIMDALDDAALKSKAGAMDWKYDPKDVVSALKREMTGERGKAWSSVGVSMPKEGEIRILLQKMRKLAQYEPTQAQMGELASQGQKYAGLAGGAVEGVGVSGVFLASGLFRPATTDSKFFMEVLMNPEARKAVMNLSAGMAKREAGAKSGQALATLVGLLSEEDLKAYNDRMEQAVSDPRRYFAKPTEGVFRVSPEQMRSGEYAPRIR